MAHEAGKGGASRPLSVPREVFNNNFDAIQWPSRVKKEDKPQTEITEQQKTDE